ncbi:MAG TPA: hypothetical protein PK715_08735, partial [Chitinophagales bacterium]|nr:hypothetical protein [Chitinophagales bacterium]
QTVTYTYTDVNGCSDVASSTITVIPVPVVDAGIYGPVCETSGLITLVGSPVGGVFSGTGVTGNTFDPGVGTQTVTYTYTDVNGCSDVASTTIVVGTTISVTLTANDATCGDTNGSITG